MAHFLDRQFAYPYTAATPVAQYIAVVLSASTSNQVLPLTTASPGEPLGVAIATGASPGDAISVQVIGVAKCVAQASLGPGANVGVKNASGALGPQGASAAEFRVGISTEAAAAGQIFSVLLKPGKVGA